jgi:hypothetical protein
MLRLAGSAAGHDLLGQPGAHNGDGTGKLTSALYGFWGEVPMRLYRISFLAGLAAGYVAGARAGRERYDQIVKLAKQAREHPAVQQATSTATTQASSLINTAGQKVADSAPKFASTAMQKAGDHIPMLKHRDGHGSSADNSRNSGKQRPVSATSGNSHQGQSKSLRVSRRGGAARHGSS